MKKSKAPIIILIVTFLVLCAAIANLVYSIHIGQSVVMGIGIAVVMAGIFIACAITAVKDMKNQSSADDDDDSDDDDDDDE